MTRKIKVVKNNEMVVTIDDKPLDLNTTEGDKEIGKYLVDQFPSYALKMKKGRKFNFLNEVIELAEDAAEGTCGHIDGHVAKLTNGKLLFWNGQTMVTFEAAK